MMEMRLPYPARANDISSYRSLLDNLKNRRTQLALRQAKVLLSSKPEDSIVLICYAWALADIGDMIEAVKHAEKAIALDPLSTLIKSVHGYILMRAGSFEGSLLQNDKAIDEGRDILAFSFYNKAKTLAALYQPRDIMDCFELSLVLDHGKHPEWESNREFFQAASDLLSHRHSHPPMLNEYQKYLDKANEKAEYWFVILVLRILLEDKRIVGKIPELKILYIETLLKMGQWKSAEVHAAKMADEFDDNMRYQKAVEQIDFIKESLKSHEPKQKAVSLHEILERENNRKPKFNNYHNKYIQVLSSKICLKIDSPPSIKYVEKISKDETRLIGYEINFADISIDDGKSQYSIKSLWKVTGEAKQINGKVTQDSSDAGRYNIIFWMQPEDRPSPYEGIIKVEVYVENILVSECVFSIGEPKPLTYANIDSIVNETMRELNTLVGLQNVKDMVAKLVQKCKLELFRNNNTTTLWSNISPHLVFLGNPGTGKTTVARLIGKLYKSLGLLPFGNVVEVDRADFVGAVIGETEQKTAKVIQLAIGNVLFIDEAYSLVKEGSDFGKIAIEILVRQMENRRGEFAVIVAGYPKEMKVFFEGNSGLRGRFDREVLFNDYAPEELLEICKMVLFKQKYEVDEKANKALEQKFIELYRNRTESFANAREVRKIVEACKSALGERFFLLPEYEQSLHAASCITEADVESAFKKEVENMQYAPVIDYDHLKIHLKELHSLIGLANVKNEVGKLVNSLEIRQRRLQLNMKKVIRTMHMCFTGNPGTGKTTVAKIVSGIFKDLGMLSRGHLVEVERADLIGSHVGDTERKTKELINKALGGTLFIDEAYSLNGGRDDFGKVAIETLITSMENYRDDFAVIVAGYSQPMKEFLQMNPGLECRFDFIVEFEDFTPEQLYSILEIEAAKWEYLFDSQVKERLQERIWHMWNERSESFGNGRAVREYFGKVVSRQEQRLRQIQRPSREQLSIILPQDVE